MEATFKGGVRMRPDIDEAMRYLGVRSDPQGELRTRMTSLAEELCSRCMPRWIWRAFPLAHEGDQPVIGLGPVPLSLPGKSARAMLGGSERCVILVCTLGLTFDTWLRQEQARDMQRAVMLDALGSAFVEAACDAAEREIAAHLPRKHLTDRFSPGYGDLPLTLQPALLSVTGAHRIGVTLTDSLLMNPQKRVSAIVGISDTPQPARIRGCAHCHLREHCAYRKAGTTCHV